MGFFLALSRGNRVQFFLSAGGADYLYVFVIHLLWMCIRVLKKI